MRWILERNRSGRSALVWVLVTSFLFLSGVAASPRLHQWLHPDAGMPGHHCAVTLFAGEHFDAAPASASVAPPPLFTGIHLLPNALIVASADYHFSPSRAPPSCA